MMATLRHSDMAVEANGNILVLVCSTDVVPAIVITRCDPSGAPLERVAIKELPDCYGSRFFPSSITVWKGMIYLNDTDSRIVVVIDACGRFLDGSLPCSDSGARGAGMAALGRMKDLLLNLLILITKPSYWRHGNDCGNSLF